MKATPLLAIQDLVCSRAERQLFAKINFSLHEGNGIFITGANGSGKSSLLKVLTGLLPTETGEILWRRQSLSVNKSDYYTNLAYLGHKNGLKTSLTVAENLITFNWHHPIFLRSNYQEWLSQFHLLSLLNCPVAQLSAGQCQRVALLKIFLSGKTLWILDEPLTALDKTAIELFQQVLNHHLQHQGAVILASHQEISLAPNSWQHIHLASNE